MDQASALLAASCARNPAVPKTSPSWRLSEDQSQIVVPPRDGLAPQSEPHSEPVHIAPRPSSPALCQSNAKGYLLPDFYSGCATGIPGRFSEGLAEAIGALTAPGFRGPLAGAFSAGPWQPGADARTDITWRATTPATPTDIGLVRG